MPCRSAKRAAFPGVGEATPRTAAAGTCENPSKWASAMKPEPTSPMPTSRIAPPYRSGPRTIGAMAAQLTDEGRIEVERGFTIAYRVYGEGSRTLLALHGGPGASSHYLDRLAEAVGGGRRLVLYDQLGGGDSDRPDDPGLWQIPRFVAEVETVRTALDLGVVTLYGQSWGGMLALAYTVDHPDNVDALVLSNTYANGKDYLLDISEHRMALGKDMHALMLRHEHADDLKAPEYLDAVLELNSRHLRRSSPYDPETSRQEFREVEARYMADTGP